MKHANETGFISVSAGTPPMTNLDVATLGEAIGSFVADTTGNLADADVRARHQPSRPCLVAPPLVLFL